MSIAPADRVRTMPTRMVRSAAAAAVVAAATVRAARATRRIQVAMFRVVISRAPHLRLCREGLLRRRPSGDAAKDRRRHQTRAAGIVEIEQAADQFSGRIKPWDDRTIDVDHLRAAVDAHASEGEGDA